MINMSNDQSNTKSPPSTSQAMAQKPIVAIVPTAGMGHLIPLVQLAKKLVSNNFLVTFILPSNGPPPEAQTKILQSLPSSINSVVLPPVSLDDLPGSTRAETQLCLTISRSLPSIRQAFESLVENNRVVAVVADLFGTDVFDVAKEFNVPPYLYFLCPTFCLSLLFHFHVEKLDQLVSCDFHDMDEPVEVPGFGIPLHGRDFPDPLQDRNDDAYKWILHHSKRYSLAEGILVNSFIDLEKDGIKVLQESNKKLGYPPVFPIGPIIQSGSRSQVNDDGSKSCLEWLDDQMSGSVLFVSFGSGGTLSSDQLNELALGLELSGQKFVWVVKSPNNSAANASYFSAESGADPFGFLPDGFVERTKSQGLLVPSWAPQVQVLSHGSTGGFLTHCGWNSSLEGIVCGVPMIAWPLYAEQKMNAVLLVDDLKLALRPEFDENGMAGREEIAKVVRGLMAGEEGKVVRDRIRWSKEAAAKAVSEEGSSTKSFNELVLNWKKE